MRFPRLSLLLVGLVWVLIAVGGTLRAEASFSYTYVPKQLYPGQVFPVTVLGTGLSSGAHPKLRYDPFSSVQPLDPRPLIQRNNDSVFYTFYFKAKGGDLRLPQLIIRTEGNKTAILKSRHIPVFAPAVPKDANFSGVIASQFRIKTSQVSTFDEQNNLVYLDIQAREANLEDMRLPGVVEQGLEKIRRRLSEVESQFYFVVPASTRQIRFSYYDPLQHRFVPVTVSTSYRHNLTAAQDVELNPKDSSFTKIKKYSFTLLGILFLILFLWRRRWFYLLLSLVSFAILITFFIPHKKICVRQGAPLYILPTFNSTVGTRFQSKRVVPVLHRYGHYYKVEYRHGTTGWIKDEDVCKN